jgi:hypothetical protein
MTSTGQTTLQNVSNSINAFQVQDSNGGTAFNVDTADDFVGIGTATPHAQLEVSGDAYLGTQTLTANDQADVCLFGNSTCSAAQSGAFNNQLKIFGGSSSANNLFLYQAVGGNAYVGSTAANLVVETTSSNANILLEANGSGQIISDTISAFYPNSPGNAESWHNFSLSSGFSAGTDINSTTYNPAYRLLSDGDVELSGVVNITATYTSPATFAVIPSQYRPSTYVLSCTVSNSIGNTFGQVILRPNGNVQIHTTNYTSGWTFNLDGCILPLYGR